MLVIVSMFFASKSFSQESETLVSQSQAVTQSREFNGSANEGDFAPPHHHRHGPHDGSKNGEDSSGKNIPPELKAQLTAEQQAQLIAAKTMDEKKALLDSWGIQPPARPQHRGRPGSETSAESSSASSAASSSVSGSVEGNSSGGGEQ